MADNLIFKVVAEGVDAAKKQLGELQKDADKLNKTDVNVNVDAKGGDKATGMFGKIKGAAGDVVKGVQNIAGPLAAAGGSIAAFVTKGVGEFKDLGLEVSKFATISGQSLQDASRNIELAKDSGVEVDTLAGAFQRLNREAESTPEKFDSIGASIIRNKDGTLNSQATFLSVVDALNSINDSGQRSQAAFDIFGKGFSGIAQIVEQGAPKIRENLASVSDEKIFDERKVAEAKALREAFDTISDASDDLFLSIGQAVAPAVAKLAPAFADAVDALQPLVDGLADGLTPALDGLVAVIGPVSDAFKGLTSFDMPGWLDAIVDPIQNLVNPFKAFGDHVATLRNELGSTPELTANVADGFDRVRSATDTATDVTSEYVDATDDVSAALQGTADALQANIDRQAILTQAMADSADASLDFQDSFDAFSEAVYKTNAAQADGTTSAGELEKMYRDLARSSDKMADSAVSLKVEQDKANGVTTSAVTKLDIWNQHMLTAAATAQGPARTAVINYMTEVNKIPPDKVTKFEAAVDAGDLQTAQAILDEASAARDVAYNSDVDRASLASTQSALDKAAQDRYVEYFAKLGLQAIIGGVSGGIKGVTSAAPAPPAGRSAVATLSGESAELAAASITAAPAAVSVASTAVAVPVVNQYITLPRIPTGRELARVAARWQRVNGS